VSLHPRIQKTITLVASFIFPSHHNVQDEPFSRRSHGICFWDRNGFLLVDFMPKRTIINAEVYCNTLKKLRRAIQNRRRGMLTQGVSLLHYNVRHHTARVSQELLTSFGWDIVTHPPLFTRLGAFGLSLFH
jgi:tRNA(Met) C34 N-acetyltransferase TmcA